MLGLWCDSSRRWLVILAGILASRPPTTAALGGGGPHSNHARLLTPTLRVCACVCCAYERSYGFAIILLTVLVKAATYPLTKKQVGCGGVPGGLSGRSFCPNDGSSSSSSSVRLSLPHLERRPFVSRRWSRR